MNDPATSTNKKRQRDDEDGPGVAGSYTITGLQTELADIKEKIKAQEDERIDALEKKIQAQEAKINLYEEKVDERIEELEKKKGEVSLTPMEKTELRNLNDFLELTARDRAQRIADFRKTLKGYQDEKLTWINLLSSASRDSKRRRVGGNDEAVSSNDEKDQKALVNEFFDTVRKFIAEKGPVEPFHLLAKDLPAIPLGRAKEKRFTTLGNTSDAYVSDFTESVVSFLQQCDIISETASGGEVKNDTALGTLFAACKALCSSLHSAFNLASASSTGKGKNSKRPDTLVTVKDFDVLRGESKANANDLQVAVGELTTKMRHWSAAYYGDLPGVLGIASAGQQFSLHYISREGNNIILLKSSLGNTEDVVSFVRYVIAAVVYTQCRVVDEEWGQAKNGVTLRKAASPNPYIDKNYEKARPNLATFYDKTKNIVGLERGTRPPKDESNTRFFITPFGCTRKPHPFEACEAMKQLAETVRGIHEVEWCHRDLRWPNIVLDCTKEGRRWTVIDCEYAAKIGTAWKDSNPPEYGFRDDLKDPIKANDSTVSVYRDYWMLGVMIKELGLDDNDYAVLNRIGEGLRSVPEARNDNNDNDNNDDDNNDDDDNDDDDNDNDNNDKKKFSQAEIEEANKKRKKAFEDLVNLNC